MCRRLILTTAVAILLVGAYPLATSAHPPGDRLSIESIPGRTVQVLASSSPFRSGPIRSPTLLAAPNEASLAPSADIQVTYGTGFPQSARDVMEAAVAVWESHISSPKVIHVNAKWMALPTNVLAQAGPADFHRMSGGDRWYPTALYEAICNCESLYVYEISASFSSLIPWYLGSDGNLPANQYDFYTIVLHELAHGLGFISSFDVDGLYGQWGYANGGPTYPVGFDLDEWSASTGGNRLTNTAVYPNPSSALKTQLTDGSVFFGGPNVVAEYGGRAPLFAPATWQSGSSNSHFDETVFGPGTVNGLMTPYFDDGEAIHEPGLLALALFRDIGWNLVGDETAPGAPTNVSATPGNGQAHVSWSAPISDGGNAINSYTATSNPGSKTCATDGELSCTVTGLTNGTPYTFTVTATNGVGTGPPSTPSNSVTPAPPGPANDNFGSAQAISGRSGTVSGSNVNATGQSGEPLNTSTSSPIQSVWYAWTAPEAGDATIDLCGSGFDTTLGVYTGAAVGSLTRIASDDDTGCGLASQVTFAAVGLMTYRISIDGYASAQGAIVMNYSLVADDTTAPAVQAPRRTLLAPQTLGTTALLRLVWTAASDPSGIAAYELQRKKGTGSWVTVALPTPTATSVDVAVKPNTNYTFRLRARDGANNTGLWATTSKAKLVLVQETPSTKLSYVGAFTRSALTGSSGGYVRQTGTAGRIAKFTFTGSSVAFLSTLAKSRGKAEIWLDGAKVATLDLYRSTTLTKRIAWAASVNPGTHLVEIRVLGAKNAAATSTRVDIDGFLTLP